MTKTTPIKIFGWNRNVRISDIPASCLHMVLSLHDNTRELIGWNRSLQIWLVEIQPYKADWMKYKLTDLIGYNTSLQSWLEKIQAYRADWSKYKLTKIIGWNTSLQRWLVEIQAYRADWMKYNLTINNNSPCQSYHCTIIFLRRVDYWTECIK